MDGEGGLTPIDGWGGEKGERLDCRRTGGWKREKGE